MADNKKNKVKKTKKSQALAKTKSGRLDLRKILSGKKKAAKKKSYYGLNAEQKIEGEADIMQLYLHEISFENLLTAEEEHDLAVSAKKGDKAAKERLINANLRLVVNIARYYNNRGVSVLDLIEEGNIGLMKAVDKFDPELGYKFSTYATWWIKQAMGILIMNHSRTVRLPVHILKKTSVCLKAIQKLSTKFGCHPSSNEVSKYTKIPLTEVERLLSYMDKIVSLDIPVGEGAENPFSEVLADLNTVNPKDWIENEEINKILLEAIKELPEKHREILLRRYGIGNHEIETLVDLGENIGLTRERVRQLQMDALKHLHFSLTQAGIDSDTLFK